MKKIKQIIAVVILTTIVTSCSGPTERVVKAENVEFSGKLNPRLQHAIESLIQYLSV